MDEADYDELCAYLAHGDLPLEFTSNKANFLTRVSNFALNYNGELTRNSKICVRRSEREILWKSYHCNEF